MEKSGFHSGLPMNLDSLLHLRGIEDNRVEFKAKWDENIKAHVIRTICAFANDILNLNGGYIIIGVEEGERGAKLPPRGLNESKIDSLQREINGACRNIKPHYIPILFPEVYQEKIVLIIWAPGSDARPHKAPENVNQKGSQQYYYIRQGSETIQARGELLRQLMELSSKIPFDDRRNLEAKIEDLSPTLVRSYLTDISSYLVEGAYVRNDLELYRKLRLVIRTNDHEVPRNISLMFFNEEPHKFFRSSLIEIVQFGDEGDIIEERAFRGPLNQQIKSTLGYLDALGGRMLQKIRGQA
jgi:ATP-dependent DNA helicase RecG